MPHKPLQRSPDPAGCRVHRHLVAADDRVRKYSRQCGDGPQFARGIANGYGAHAEKHLAALRLWIGFLTHVILNAHNSHLVILTI